MDSYPKQTLRRSANVPVNENLGALLKRVSLVRPTYSWPLSQGELILRKARQKLSARAPPGLFAPHVGSPGVSKSATEGMMIELQGSI